MTYFHIILTERCNSECRYCYKKSMEEFDDELNKKFKFDYSVPVESQVKISELKQFLEKDKNPKIIFYGGEPLTNIKKLKEIMENIDAEFYMQTNGKLLDKLPAKYMNKFRKILVSIDGDKERTDFNKGEGTYDLILKNIKLIRKKGFKGEIVARMTISFTDGFTDLTKQVKHLFKIDFDSVHWQLDAGFYKSDFNEKIFSEFVEKYNKEVSLLINYWVSEMKKGKVWKIYPFLGIFQSIYRGEKTKLRCGSGHSNYTITTNEKLVCCPIMNSITDFYVGDLKSNPQNLKQISVIEPCTSCNYLDLCGGRCLYSNHAKLWPKSGEKLICQTVKHLIDELKKQTSKIKELIDKKIISKDNLEYEKYFGPEIIP